MPFHRDIRGNALHAPSNEKIENNTGSNINKLSVVKLDNYGTLFPQVLLATSTSDQTFGITTSEILNGTTGYAMTLGFLLNVDTSSWPIGTILYTSATGALSDIPFGGAVAVVVKQDASCGAMYVNTIKADIGGDWLLLGNSATDPDVNFLGTQDNVGLTFRTNNNQRIRIDENGKVLIGNQTVPSGFFHIKQHSNYEGSGHIIETATIQVGDTSYNNLYSIVLPNFSTVMMEFRVVGIEAGNTERVSFVRTGTWFRQGANAQRSGHIQSDYTNKSDNNFDLRFTETGDTVFLDIKNANANNTRWEVTVKMDIILNDA